jgi:hypothetical protein
VVRDRCVLHTRVSAQSESGELAAASGSSSAAILRARGFYVDNLCADLQAAESFKVGGQLGAWREATERTPVSSRH